MQSNTMNRNGKEGESMSCDCEKIRELIYDYAENRLDEEQSAAVREHLERCDACRREYSQICSLLSDMKGSEMTPPMTLVGGVIDAIASYENEKKRTAARRRINNFGVIAAGFLIILSVGAMYHMTDGIKPHYSAGSAQTGVDIENEQYSPSFDMADDRENSASEPNTDGWVGEILGKDESDKVTESEYTGRPDIGGNTDSAGNGGTVPPPSCEQTEYIKFVISEKKNISHFEQSIELITYNRLLGYMVFEQNYHNMSTVQGVSGGLYFGCENGDGSLMIPTDKLSDVMEDAKKTIESLPNADANRYCIIVFK